MTDHILVTGFNAFAGRTVNAAATVAQALQSQRVGHLPVNTVFLKVNWQSIENFARQSLPLSTARCVVALGEADRSHISIETKATNVCSGDDVDGQSPPVEQPDNRQEFTLADSHIDTARIQALTKVCQSNPGSICPTLQTPIELSEDAGSYLCNRLLYLGLQHSPVPFIFIHLPIQGDTANKIYLQQTLPAVTRVIHAFAQPSADSDTAANSLSTRSDQAD